MKLTLHNSNSDSILIVRTPKRKAQKAYGLVRGGVYLGFSGVGESQASLLEAVCGGCGMVAAGLAAAGLRVLSRLTVQLVAVLRLRV